MKERWGSRTGRDGILSPVGTFPRRKGLTLAGLIALALGILISSAGAQEHPLYRFYAFSGGRILWGFLDASGAVAIPARYREAGDFCEGLAAVRSGGGWGWIDAKGAVVIRPTFTGAGCFSEGLAGASTEDGFGFVDRTGRMVVPPRYAWVEPFHEGVGYAGRQDGVREYIDREGNVLATVLQGLEFSEGLAPFAAKGGRWGYLDTTGQVVIEPRFLRALVFHDGLAPVVERTNEGANVWSYIDRSGARAFEEFFGEAQPFSEGVAAVVLYRPPGSGDGPAYRWGHIDRTGKPAYPPGPYLQAGPFSDGLAAVMVEPGHWGFIDGTGAMVIDPEYLEVFAPFRNGVAGLITNPERRLVFIDKTGKVLWRGDPP